MKSKVLYSAFPKSIIAVRAPWLGVLHRLLTGAKHCLYLNCGCEGLEQSWGFGCTWCSTCVWWVRYFQSPLISGELRRAEVVRTFQCKNIAAMKLLGLCVDLHWHSVVLCEPFTGCFAVTYWCHLSCCLLWPYCWDVMKKFCKSFCHVVVVFNCVAS